MFAVALIVFRETLEAALIVSIVLAASNGIPGRGRWVGGGVACGAMGAVLVALFAAGISEAFAGNGQELLNAAILGLAVCMLAWHNIWMARHAREFMIEARAIGQSVRSGGRPTIALALITGAAVLREGSETVLFLFGVAASSVEGPAAFVAGAALGLAGGCAIGLGLYFGLLRIPLGRLFTVMGVLVLFLAAGLAAQCVAFLAQANVLPELGDRLWDTSFLLTEASIPGKILHTLIGYVARPSGIQVLAWAGTAAAIGLPMWLFSHRRSLTVLAVATAGLIGLANPAAADLQVRLPHVDWREVEFEHNGLITFGRKGSPADRAQSYTNAIGYGVTPWWKIELEGEATAGGGRKPAWTATTFENRFQLTERGKYMFDVGFFFEYSQVPGLAPNSLTFGPILYREQDIFGLDTAHTLNLFFSRDVGGGATRDTGFQLGWKSLARLAPLFAPGVEYYTQVGSLGQAGTYNQQTHYAGPVLTGLRSFAPYGKVKYEVGYLFGLTTATPRGAIRWKLEYEIAF